MAERVRPILPFDFLNSIEKSFSLALFSEQPGEAAPLGTQLAPPQPLQIQRESGSFAISADDMIVDIDAANGLRQVNASAGVLAAYRFYGRPIGLAVKLKRIQPLLQVAARVTAPVEETPLLVSPR